MYCTLTLFSPQESIYYYLLILSGSHHHPHHNFLIWSPFFILYQIVCSPSIHMVHLKTITIIYIYKNCLLIDYKLKNKLKLTFRIINVKIELVMSRQYFLRDQSLHQNNLENSLTKTILLRRVALLAFLYTQLNSSQSNLAYSNLTSTTKLIVL